MRIKALSDGYKKRIVLRFAAFIIATAGYFISSLYLDDWFRIASSSFWYVLILYVVSPPVLFVLALSLLNTAQKYRKLTDLIGRRRWVTLDQNALHLEDVIDGAKVARTYAWDDIQRIEIVDITIFRMVRKKKTKAVAFVLDELEYDCFSISCNYNPERNIEYLDWFFFMMDSPDVHAAISQHWHGEVETVDR